jgi:membrane-associated protease RseP (regulator of RpoE activity)
MANFLAVSIAIAIAKVQKIPAKMLFDSAEMIFLGEGTTFSGILGFFVISSLMQASSNLLPIEGFDGGRVVYCLLAMAFGERAAEVTLDITSALVAFILWTVALYLMLKISAGLGVYVFALGIFASNVMKTQRTPTKLIS